MPYTMSGTKRGCTAPTSRAMLGVSPYAPARHCPVLTETMRCAPPSVRDVRCEVLRARVLLPDASASSAGKDPSEADSQDGPSDWYAYNPYANSPYANSPYTKSPSTRSTLLRAVLTRWCGATARSTHEQLRCYQGGDTRRW